MDVSQVQSDRLEQNIRQVASNPVFLEFIREEGFTDASTEEDAVKWIKSTLADHNVSLDTIVTNFVAWHRRRLGE